MSGVQEPGEPDTWNADLRGFDEFFCRVVRQADGPGDAMLFASRVLGYLGRTIEDWASDDKGRGRGLVCLHEIRTSVLAEVAAAEMRRALDAHDRAEAEANERSVNP